MRLASALSAKSLRNGIGWTCPSQKPMTCRLLCRCLDVVNVHCDPGSFRVYVMGMYWKAGFPPTTLGMSMLKANRVVSPRAIICEGFITSDSFRYLVLTVSGAPGDKQYGPMPLYA